MFVKKILIDLDGVLNEYNGEKFDEIQGERVIAFLNTDTKQGLSFRYFQGLR